MPEVKRLGRKPDNQGCLTEAFPRYKQSRGLSTAISTQLFLQGCLQASHQTPGFCDGVPKPTDFIKGGLWQKQQCAHNDLRDSYCPQIFAQVQSYCDMHRPAE